jgi:hypothetical protein
MTPASLEDWFAINTLFVRYATSLDACDVAAVIDCFEPDGTLESPVLGKFVGHAGIRAFAERTVKLKGKGVQFRHVVSNLRAAVAGDRGHAKCYLLDFLTKDGKTELLSPGEYDCDLRRRAGVWRFTRRDVAMDRLFVLPDALTGPRQKG